MSKTQEELEFEQYYVANILRILDEVVVQLAQERAAKAAREQRAAEWAAEILAKWTANVEQRVQEEMQAAGLLAGNE